jgi:hypothetical protein
MIGSRWMAHAATIGIQGLVALCMVAGVVVRADESAPWEFALTPYYWWVGLDADVSVADQTFHLRSGDTIDPDLGAMAGHFEAFRGAWGTVWAGQHLVSEANPGSGDVEKVQSQHTRLDAMLAYRYRRELPHGMRLDVIPMAGLRYRNIRQAVVPVEGDTVERTRNNFEPVFAARMEWWLSHRLSLGVMGEAGGFDLSGAPRLQWGLTPMVRYQVGREFALLAGYRWEHMTYERGSSMGRLSFDGSYDGAWLGLSIDFEATPAPAPVDPSSARGLLDDPLRYVTSGIMSEVPPDAAEGDYRFRRWMNRAHHRFNGTLDRWVDDLDTVLAEGEKPLQQREKSKFYVSLDLQLKEYEDGLELDLRPGINVRLDIPNLEHDATFLLTHQAIDELPGADPFEKERGLSLGVESRGWLIKKARFRVSVRSSSQTGIDLETRYYWEPSWRHHNWVVKPHLGVYYSGEKGFGTLSFLFMEYHLVDRFQGFYLPAINQNEELQSAEFSHNFVLLYQFEGTDEDYHRAVMTRLSIEGTLDENAEVYRWEPIGYRAPLYKKWLYYHLAPQVNWRRENNWEPEMALRLYIEALFFGTEER